MVTVFVVFLLAGVNDKFDGTVSHEYPAFLSFG